MKRRKGTSGLGIACAAALAAVAGCSARTSPAVDRAEAAYESAAADPQIAANAAVELREARQSLDRARGVLDDNASEEAVEHYAYVTEQQVEIARAEARRKQADDRIAELNRGRGDVLAGAAQARVQELEQELENARRTDKGVVLTLGDVLFATGQAEIKAGAMQNLYKLASYLQKNPGRSIVIEGHTDDVGSDALNQDLSRRRAEAVRRFLVSSGIPSDRVIARGFGEAFPVAPNTNVAGRQQNRRVEVVILDAGEETADATTGGTPLGMQR